MEVVLQRQLVKKTIYRSSMSIVHYPLELDEMGFVLVSELIKKDGEWVEVPHEKHALKEEVFAQYVFVIDLRRQEWNTEDEFFNSMMEWVKEKGMNPCDITVSEETDFIIDKYKPKDRIQIFVKNRQ